MLVLLLLIWLYVRFVSFWCMLCCTYLVIYFGLVFVSFAWGFDLCFNDVLSCGLCVGLWICVWLRCLCVGWFAIADTSVLVLWVFFFSFYLLWMFWCFVMSLVVALFILLSFGIWLTRFLFVLFVSLHAW